MLSRSDTEAFWAGGYRQYLPHVSVDSVVFGFQDGQLRVLLLRWKGLGIWSLPGGYVKLDESLDAAAVRVLRDRTGLRRVFLRQFRTFGGIRRHEAHMTALFEGLGLEVPRGAWPLGRVVSVGYLALVDFAKVRPVPDFVSDACTWHPVERLPKLAFDHRAIVRVALATLRAGLDSEAMVANLLPPRFTMPELQRLHEGLLGRRLDRRNFRKQMIDRGVVVRLPARRTGGAHRAPYLYRFTG